jgi:hypothetical protein
MAIKISSAGIVLDFDNIYIEKVNFFKIFRDCIIFNLTITIIL